MKEAEVLKSPPFRMIVKGIALALICVLLIPGYASGAAPPPDLVKQPQSKREVTLVPEPVALVPEWWRFFEVPEQEKLEQRVKETMARLEQLLATDYGQSAESVRPLVE